MYTLRSRYLAVPFSPNNSWKTYSLPVRARQGCLPWDWNRTEVLISNLLCCVYDRAKLHRDISTSYSITVTSHERLGPSSHWHLDYVFNRLFILTTIWKKTSNHHITVLCEGKTPVPAGGPSQRVSIAESAWRHHVALKTRFAQLYMLSETKTTLKENMLVLWLYYGG